MKMCTDTHFRITANNIKTRNSGKNIQILKVISHRQKVNIDFICSCFAANYVSATLKSGQLLCSELSQLHCHL